MDKNKIKSFAIWARRNLIAAVSEKANRIGIAENSIEEAIVVQGGFQLKGKEEIFPLSKRDRDALVSQVKEKGFEQVMEEVAYTWFNRFMGIRYMEVNDYLPSGVRMLSSEVEGKIEPDVLTKVSEIIEELGLNGDEIYNLLDTGDTLDREKAYRIILVKQCNELGKIIPQMFEKISDYTELLLPDNLLEEGSVIRRMVSDIEEADWREEVEIIGWMYQYYIAEEKDRVIQAKKRYKVNEIPFATQLFTPKWIVKYMVQNSLGRYWVEANPEQNKIIDSWDFYISNKEEYSIGNEINNLRLEDIKVFDPAMGSGNILIYSFDLLYDIYLKNGYSEKEIPKLILEKNLYGLDIDDRAVQLASFALIMKARSYNRRFFRDIKKNGINLNVVSIQQSNKLTIEHFELLKDADAKCTIKEFSKIFFNAKIYGSLIDIDSCNININDIYNYMAKIKNQDGYNLIELGIRDEFIEIFTPLLKQYSIMNQKYDILITNPPYMGNKYMESELAGYINSKYADVKADMFTAFIKYSFSKVKEDGHLGFVTPFVWMFIKSYEELRKYILENKSITSLIQLEYNAFPEACVPVCTFTLRNNQLGRVGEYIKLSEFKGVDIQSIKVLEAIENPSIKYRYSTEQSVFKEIPGNPIAYWVSKNLLLAFKEHKKLGEVSEIITGMTTGDNNKYLKFWYEPNLNNLAIGISDMKEVDIKINYWFPYNKGGEFRKWYGNNDYVVDWSRSKEFNRAKTTLSHLYLKEGITWSFLTSYKFSARFFNKGYLWDVAGSPCFVDEDKIKYILGFLCTKIANEILDLINPTLNYQAVDLQGLPIIVDECKFKDINKIVDENILLSKSDWDSYETSIDFKVNPLINNSQNEFRISSAFNEWSKKCNERFNKLKDNEETLNEIFIKIYNLEDDFTKEVDERDITVRKYNKEQNIKELISYFVGCLFGRYSIDTDGIIYAGGDFNYNWNQKNALVRKVEKDDNDEVKNDYWIKSRFTPDIDNIIPIIDDEYFEDDIVTRFIDFIRIVYGNRTLEENLDFIADSIGRKSSETSRQAIRRYFIKDFYKDHLKVYQKRPIYWMFESGKNDGFKCLVYMHRYDEQTVAKVRTDYLHTLQRKYESEINRLQLVVDSEEYTAKDRTAAKKKIDRISKQIEECREYDQVMAYLANEKISIDLDDGVKVNYAKFQDIKIINSKGKEVKMNLLAKI